ncbi:alkaline phosphatase family protein [Collimonas sp. NPDC087041]|uniref:alkaline phosphatase family protein n=1 Tax=Collimonas sp. NPDC087041 TaxID=3363960 RepID=UPI00380418E2
MLAAINKYWDLRKLVFVGLAATAFAVCDAESTVVQKEQSQTAIDYSQRKALVIGVDGMQYEKLQEAIAAGRAPNLAQFTIAKSYIGGVVGTVTQQSTYSGPGWSTILTGAWSNRHRVTGNDSRQRNQTKSIFRLIKEATPSRRTASIISWNTINDNFARDIELAYIDRVEKCSDIDQCVAEKASSALRFEVFSFVFAHFDEPDLTGHAQGFGDAYQAAIQGVDTQVGQLLAALRQRQVAYPDEDWLIIVTPDHGRAAADGHSHGNQTLSEKTTFIAINKPANAQLSAPISDPDNMNFGGLYGNATQADIVPTVLAHLGVKPNLLDYPIDGVSLIGELGVRLLAVQINNTARSATLKWRNTSAQGKPLTIYRDGKLLATLTDQVSEYVDNDLKNVQDGVVDLNYTVVVNDVPQSYLARANFSAAISSNPSLLMR